MVIPACLHLVGNLDAIFDTADNDNEDASGKNTTNNQEHTVDAVEVKGDTLETIGTIPLDKLVFCLQLFNPDLPLLFLVGDIICSIDWFVLVIVMKMNDSF